MGPLPIAVLKHRTGLNDINTKHKLNESETHFHELLICYASEYF